MNRRAFLGATAVAALGQVRKRTNVLFITADDLGPLLSCYGEKRISTPNLDKLAASGVRFEVAYVAQASCSPSRSAMLTGLYPHSNGQFGLVNTGHELHAHLQDKTIPNVLKEHGYRTGIIGKLHVAPEQKFQFDFRHHVGVNTRRVRDVAKLSKQFFTETGDKPFFLMVNFSDPHAFRRENEARAWYFPPQVDNLPAKPIPATRETLFDWQGIDTPEQRERTANYLNAVLRLDDGIGMLMDELKSAGHLEDTAIIFCGDHGPPFDRGKTTAYEHGLRVPFMVRWPGVSKTGVSSKAMVSTVDIAPTIYEIAGVKAPIAMHGKSLRTVLDGSTRGWRQYLGAEFHRHGANPFYPRRTVRDDRYHIIHNLLASRNNPPLGIDGDKAHKIVNESRYDGTPVRRAFDRYAHPPEFELYDVSTDPLEFVNIADKPEAKPVLNRMKAALLEWRKETQDPFLDPAVLEKLDREGAPLTRQPGAAKA